MVKAFLLNIKYECLSEHCKFSYGRDNVNYTTVLYIYCTSYGLHQLCLMSAGWRLINNNQSLTLLVNVLTVREPTIYIHFRYCTILCASSRRLCK